MHTNTRNINVDTAKKASNGRFYNVNYPPPSGFAA